MGAMSLGAIRKGAVDCDRADRGISYTQSTSRFWQRVQRGLFSLHLTLLCLGRSNQRRGRIMGLVHLLAFDAPIS